MCTNNNAITTRSIVMDYFDWRLNNKTITNNRLFLLVHKIAADCETTYRSQSTIYDFQFLSSLNDLKNLHQDIAEELFNDGGITWTRIITFISFSALLAERFIQQQNIFSSDLIISSITDWTINFIDTDLHSWLHDQNYWVNLFFSIPYLLTFFFSLQAGCLKTYDRTPQRRNSIGRYASILGTLGEFKHNTIATIEIFYF
jgi:hypothetical protein